MMAQLEFTIKGNEYRVKDIRVGNFIDYERYKASLSGGMYGSIFRMGTFSGDESLLMVDIEAFLTVFTPTVLKDLKCDSFKDLGIEDYKIVKAVYLEKILPWYGEYIKALKPEPKTDVTE